MKDHSLRGFGRIGPTGLRILAALMDRSRRSPIPYSIKELMRAIGVRSPTGIMEHVAKLLEAGLIRKGGPRQARTLVPCAKFITEDDL
jgi:DNA-binding transcriptional ArsR family regulator